MIAGRAGDLDVRGVAKQTVAGVGEHDLLTFASAIAFQTLTGLLPLAMFTVALGGLVGLSSVWAHSLAPSLARHASHPLYELVNQGVSTALRHERGFWLSLGLALTIWELSGALRAVMEALSRTYGEDGGADRRSRRRRYLLSFGLSVAMVLIVVAAVSLMLALPRTIGLAGAVIRWPAAFALLVTLVWLILRFGPDEARPKGWITIGSALCALSWLGTSAVFILYATNVADYGSIFGSFAVVFVGCVYLYLSACALLIGAELDHVVAQRADREG